jgi:predicted SAM-dependent methyltransferase
MDARRVFAKRYLSGRGLEIGALHKPLKAARRAKVRYVDRMPVEELRSHYPELSGEALAPVEVIDDGEALATIPDASEDFIVANHFLEHCEDPIRTIETHLSKLNPGGVLFYAVPDKRYTFDFRRTPTPLQHMIEDYEQGPQHSRQEHYREWTRLVEEARTEEDTIARSRELEQDGYSIHMHVWTLAEFLQLLLHCRQRFADAFDIEAAAKQGIEFVVVLRKAGPPPPPPRASHLRAGPRHWLELVRRMGSSR